MPMDENEAGDLILPQAPRFYKIIRDAWAGLDRYRHDLHRMSPRSRASLVRDFMVDNAMTEFAGVPSVTPIFLKGRFFVALSERLFVQLKKFDKRRRPRNYPTQQAKNIASQQGELFELPSVTFATAGYKLDKLQTQIEEVTVACHDDQLTLWRFKIDEELGSSQTPPASLIPIPTPPSRVIPRATQTREARDDGAATS